MFDISLKCKYCAKMNASSCRKAVDLIVQGTQATHQIQAAATADSSKLESLLLSSLAADDSSPPQVNYGSEQPLTASTPRAITTPAGEIQPTDTYRQIIPGMSEHVYPTLTADDSLSTPASDDCSTFHKQITSELDKYLQEATEKHEAEDNYFDGHHTSTNTSSLQQEANYLEDENDVSIDNASNTTIPESHEQDTGLHHNSSPDCQTQLQDELAMIPEEDEEVEEQLDPADQDTLVFESEESEEEPFNTAIDTTSDDSAITMGKPVTTAFISNHVQIPTEQVGCLQVTSQLQEFLDQYWPKSTEKAFSMYIKFCKC